MKVTSKLNLKNLVFMDIETVRQNEELSIDSVEFDAWKYQNMREFPNATNEELQELYINKAALHAEFAKIVCITVGRIDGNNLKLRTYNDADEKVLLENFNSDLTLVLDANPRTAFCGHAIIGFDIPFIFKRCLINQVMPNELLDTQGEKPWTVDEFLVDTKELWKGTSFRPSSLAVVAMALDVPSPKDDISGADVGRVYYSGEKGAVERISRYCEKDVLTTANVLRRMRFEPLLEASTGVVAVEEIPLVKKIFDGGKYGVTEKKEMLEILRGMNEETLQHAFLVLEAATSTARGKKTKMTKAHVKTLKKEL